jgi:hypothetical protein
MSSTSAAISIAPFVPDANWYYTIGMLVNKKGGPVGRSRSVLHPALGGVVWRAGEV